MKTLKQFIDENYHLLTVIGVFIALFSLFNFVIPDNYTEKIYILSLILVIIFLLILEVLKDFKPANIDRIGTNYFLFQFLLILLIAIIIFFFLIYYKKCISVVLVSLLLVIYFKLFIGLVKRFTIIVKFRKFIKKFSGVKEKIIRYLIVSSLAILFTLLICLSVYLTLILILFLGKIINFSEVLNFLSSETRIPL